MGGPRLLQFSQLGEPYFLWATCCTVHEGCRSTFRTSCSVASNTTRAMHKESWAEQQWSESGEYGSQCNQPRSVLQHVCGCFWMCWLHPRDRCKRVLVKEFIGISHIRFLCEQWELHRTCTASNAEAYASSNANAAYFPISRMSWQKWQDMMNGGNPADVWVSWANWG